MIKNNKFTSILGLDAPIVQGPFNGLMTQQLTAAVSNFGALGSFGAHGLSAADITRVIGEIRALTARPFAINLWTSMEDGGASEVSAAQFDRALDPFKTKIQELGGRLPHYGRYVPLRFEEQVRAVLDARVAAFSFICGIPPREILDECRHIGTRLIGTATTPDEARALEQAGVDIIVASGFEAGGHRGSFLKPAEQSLWGTFALLPQVVDAVGVPVVASGGIADARGMVAAMALGASAVQIGTAFLTSEQAAAHPAHRAALRERRASHTRLTRNLTGRLVRGIDNELMAHASAADYQPLPYPLQRALLRSLTQAAEKAGRPEWMALWAGQSADLVREEDPVAFMRKLLHDAQLISTSLASLAGMQRD